ncbi:MAG: DUF2236 domain-containing protein [Piscinibacter sp.]|nr:DUF2236 domain-containing protein [Piscinibacter sp.]
MSFRPPVPDDLLDAAQYQADPLADDTISAILGTWPTTDSLADADAALSALDEHWERLALLNRVIAQWQANAGIADWTPGPEVPAPMAAALRGYLDAAQRLPDWADPARIARAEELFFDQGVLSVLLLFCASLPECYVVPDLADVLHTTGALEQRTDYRIRSTAAMIFPVMMRGGLTDPAGAGVAQVLKVRLIHATVRHLILRGSPEHALAPETGPRPRLSLAGRVPGMHQALFAHGWDVAERGLPSNQEEQAYTLLTFGFVPLRGMRTLGVGLDPDDERAVLHAWNVVGHLVGIRRELMVDTMHEAEALFLRMQQRGRAERRDPDPRPELAGALFRTMSREIPWAVVRPFPLLLSRHLIGARSSADLGMNGQVGWWSKLAFAVALALVQGIDALGRLVWRQFSLSRVISRLLGYRLITRLLMDETRPLKLPERLRGQAQQMMQTWCGKAAP